MNNNSINETFIDAQDTASEPAEPSVSENRVAPGLTWRIVIVLVALLIIVVLAYPFLPSRLNPGSETGNIQASSVTQTTLTAPEAIAQANPGSAKAQFESGNAYAQAGQWEQALAAYQKAIALDPNYQAAYANLGVVYFQLERFDLAASQYQKALELKPDDGEVAYNLGALYLQQALLSGSQPDPNLLDKAIAQLQQAQKLAPDLAEPYFSLGVAYNTLKQTDKAIQAFETFLDRNTSQDPRARQEAQRYLDALRSQ